jgi:outer membrane protein TolC
MIKNSKVGLNEILGRSPETEFETTAAAEPDLIPDFESLATQAEQRNSMLVMADKNLRLAELNIKQWEGNKYPTFDLNLGYNFNRSKAEIGILKFNQNSGFSYGLTGRWNLFNGFNNKREIQVARLSLESSKLAMEQQQLSVRSDLYTFYNNYLAASRLSRFEDDNLKVARQNLTITTEKMKAGTIDALELRQAQLNLVDAEFRKITAEFEARMAKLEIQRLTGKFFQN